MKTSLRLAGLTVLSSATFAGLGLLAACTTNNTNDTADGGTSSSSSSGSSGSPDGSTTSDGGSSSSSSSSGTLPTATALHTVTGLTDERVTGIYCATGSSTCVVAASQMAGDTLSHVSTFSGATVGATPVFQTSDAVSTTIGMIGDLDFLGFEKVGDRLILLLDQGSNGFISANGDPTVAANWVVSNSGHATPADFGLNHQYGFGFDGTTWIQMRPNSGIYSATAASITATTGWSNIFSVGGTPQIPENIDDQKAADATVCNSSVSYSVSPTTTQAGYVAPDASIILFPAGAVNATKAPDGAGVCISTDKGKTFKIAKLTAEQTAGNNGPTAVTCLTKDNCFLGGGQVFTNNSSYIYYSTNASAGATSTWTKATLPTLTPNDNTLINDLFFAPDGLHGWAIGAIDGTKALLLATTDGGKTWTDESATVQGLGDSSPLHAGFAVDATHFAIGGNDAHLYSTF